MAINTTTLQIKPAGPFDFANTIYSHGWVSLLPNNWDRERKIWQRVEQLDSGKVVLINARGGRSIKRPVINLEVLHPRRLSAAEQQQIVARVGHMLRFDENFAEFYHLCSTRGERWAQLSAGIGRLLRSSTVFEDVVKTICTTNVQWSGTRRMVEQLVAVYGASHAGYAQHKAFPNADTIASVPLAKFKQSVNLGYRADYVHLLAQRVTNGDLDLDALLDRGIPTAEIKRRLLAIKGVGNYAAATLLMVLGRYDQLPVDSVFRQFVSANYFGGKAISDTQAAAIYDEWRDWKYLGYWYDLWQGTATTL